ncbi:hypothetical protein [Lachnoclostridium sp.]|uniref:hypothetical protein n=1 Tax=Lachnoclostridium sp. TaxID=2028282 RepID=UPI00289B08D9|nr:hypothetical protein [Lachnoclostridium sp.]
MKNIHQCMCIFFLVLSIVYLNGCDKKSVTEIIPTHEVDNSIDQENKVLETNSEPLFTDEEIKTAIIMAEQHIDAMNQKDNKLIMKTMLPEKVNDQKERIENGEVHLYGVVTIDIESIEYLGDEHEFTKMINKQYTEQFGVENILPLFATINVKYPEGVENGEWAEGVFPNFCFIMVREDKDSSFYVYDKGF